MTASRTLPWLFTVAAIAALGLLLSAIGLAGPLRTAAQTIASPFAGAIRAVTSPVVDVVGNAGSYGELRDENRDLRQENERLRADVARLREEQARAADVDELLKLRTVRPNDTYALAAVVGRDPNVLRKLLLINRGDDDGIREGMPVLGRGGALVGTVERVQGGMSWVRLITDAQSDVNALIQESRAQAMASGQPSGAIAMEFLAQGVEVKPGDTVLTSGLGGSYPAGLLIGRVAKVDGNALDVFKHAEVEPAVRLSSLEHVAVLTSFQPLKLGTR
jgi:rod shape-determining protein MreC